MTRLGAMGSEKRSRGFAASADEAPPNRRAGGGGTADGFASLGMQWRVEPDGLVDSLIVGRRLTKAAARNKGFNSIRRFSFYGLVVWTIPWSQGKTQEYRRFRRLSAKSVSKISVTPVICEENPYAVRGGVGNFFVRAGNYFRLFDRGGENGLKSIRSPRRSTYCALSPQRRPCHARVSGHPAEARRGAD